MSMNNGKIDQKNGKNSNIQAFYLPEFGFGPVQSITYANGQVFRLTTH